MKQRFRAGRMLWVISLAAITLCSCDHLGRLDVYQKNIPVPGYQWHYSFHPSFEVLITDTAARYNIAVTVRHTGAYAFSNLWLLVTTGYAGQKPRTQRVELPLADRQGKWLGSGMDGIYEHRIPIQQNARFDKKGTYHFSFEQNMRIDPLANVMSVGLRVEKISP
ncbi:MAG TPA: gliding motility lipoprotein GldH [Chitinophagaceae bacterium]|nr:gliding motility lipoprotein GldH [Chitinophagaceae bacterium]